MDPSDTDLAAIQDLDSARRWAGVTNDLWNSVMEELGDIALLREVVLITYGDWQAAISNVAISVGGSSTPVTGIVVPPPRALTPVEKGRIRSLRRVCRILFRLDPDEDSTPIASTTPVASPAVFAQPLSEIDTITIASVLDQVTKIKVIPVSDSDIRAKFLKYKEAYGRFPARESEPTRDQISALHTVLQLQRPPYADFGVLGPFGNRLQRKLTFVGMIVGPEGIPIRKELPGPPSFDEWYSVWKVFKTLCILLDVASSEALEGYAELIRDLSKRYPWWIIYQADCRMRSEEFEIFRRDLEEQRGRLTGVDQTVADVLVPFDVQKPWEAVFLHAVHSVAGQLYWQQRVKELAADHRSSSSATASANGDGGFQAANVIKAGTKREVPWMVPRATSQPPAKPGGPPCKPFQTAAGCSANEKYCPHKQAHTCGHCGKPGHGEAKCFALHPELMTSKISAKRKKKGGKSSGTGGKGN